MQRVQEAHCVWRPLPQVRGVDVQPQAFPIVLLRRFLLGRAQPGPEPPQPRLHRARCTQQRIMKAAFALGLVGLLLLPETAQARVRCTTVEHRVRLRNVFFSNSERPNKPMVLRSSDGRASVHWDPAEVTQASAALALSLLDQALQVEVDQMGWPAPIPDRDYGGDSSVDLYFDPQSDGGAYTGPDSEDPGLDHDAS